MVVNLIFNREVAFRYGLESYSTLDVDISSLPYELRTLVCDSLCIVNALVIGSYQRHVYEMQSQSSLRIPEHQVIEFVDRLRKSETDAYLFALSEAVESFAPCLRYFEHALGVLAKLGERLSLCDGLHEMAGVVEGVGLKPEYLEPLACRFGGLTDKQNENLGRVYSAPFGEVLFRRDEGGLTYNLKALDPFSSKVGFRSGYFSVWPDDFNVVVPEEYLVDVGKYQEDQHCWYVLARDRLNEAKRELLSVLIRKDLSLYKVIVGDLGRYVSSESEIRQFVRKTLSPSIARFRARELDAIILESVDNGKVLYSLLSKIDSVGGFSLSYELEVGSELRANFVSSAFSAKWGGIAPVVFTEGLKFLTSVGQPSALQALRIKELLSLADGAKDCCVLESVSGEFYVGVYYELPFMATEIPVLPDGCELLFSHSSLAKEFEPHLDVLGSTSDLHQYPSLLNYLNGTVAGDVYSLAVHVVFK